jgi:hypothetical protein
MEPMAKAASTFGGPSRTQVVTLTPEFAISGWVVEVDLATAGEPPDRRYFAVGLAAADDAVEAVLGYPGITRDDRRIAMRALSPDEIVGLRLKPRAVRPYGWAMKR